MNEWRYRKSHFKPVLFPGVVSPCVRLSYFSGQNSHDVHKQNKVELEQKKSKESSYIDKLKLYHIHQIDETFYSGD